MFCRKFGGFTYTGRVTGQAKELMNIIGDDNVNVDMQRAFVASFDAPQKFFSSHNEIAFRVIEPDCKTWSKYRMIRKTSMQKPKIKNAKT